MKWLELSIRTSPEFVEPLSELFRRYGETDVVVQEEGDWDPDNAPGDVGPPTSVTVITYLPMDSTTPTRREMIDVGVRLVSLLQPMGPLQERVLEDKEWETAWKAHFTLLKIGKKLVVKPTWQDHETVPGEIIVELDPGMAFGTGHHPTTRMCLEQLEEHITTGVRVLDLGTGSGILSIAAAKLGAEGVTAVDVDPVALKAARTNFQRNGVDAKVRTVQGSLPHPQVPAAGFGLAVSNITAKAIISNAHHLAEALVVDGVLVVSGILREHQDKVEEALVKDFYVVDRLYDGDWVALVTKRLN